MSDSNQRTSAQASEMRSSDVWKFSTDVSDRLLTWNMLNIVTGMILGRSGGFLRGFASPKMADKRAEISQKGGRSVPKERRAFSRNPVLAREAGRKGGLRRREANAQEIAVLREFADGSTATVPNPPPDSTTVPVFPLTFRLKVPKFRFSS